MTTTTTTTTTIEQQLRGTWTALITPFQDGALDETALRSLVEFQIAGGVSGLVACGSTGETPTLSLAEFERVITIVVEQTAGRVPVMAGTGSNDTMTTIERTRIAADLGADYALVVMPWYNKPTQEGLYQHIRHVAEQSPLPIMLYNVPGRTGCDLQPATVARLAMLERVVGIKEASGDVDRVSEIVRRTGSSFAVLSGDDSLTLPMMAVGGRGVISVVSNIVPAAMSQLTSAALAGDFFTARTIHLDLLDLCGAMFVETNPVPVKAAAELLGISTSDVRLPLVPLAPESRTHLLQALLDCHFTADRLILGEETARFHAANLGTRVEVAA